MPYSLRVDDEKLLPRSRHVYQLTGVIRTCDDPACCPKPDTFRYLYLDEPALAEMDRSVAAILAAQKARQQAKIDRITVNRITIDNITIDTIDGDTQSISNGSLSTETKTTKSQTRKNTYPPPDGGSAGKRKSSALSSKSKSANAGAPDNTPPPQVPLPLPAI